MKLGTLIAVVVGAGGLVAMLTAFVNNSSPYVTVAQAKTSNSNSVHVAADMVPGTLFIDSQSQLTKFTVCDQAGAKVSVEYRGTPPANMGHVTKVVLIGGMQGDVFHASKLLVKCPSKYDSSKGAASGVKGQDS